MAVFPSSANGIPFIVDDSFTAIAFVAFFAMISLNDAIAAIRRQFASTLAVSGGGVIYRERAIWRLVIFVPSIRHVIAYGIIAFFAEFGLYEAIAAFLEVTHRDKTSSQCLTAITWFNFAFRRAAIGIECVSVVALFVADDE